MEPGDIVDFYEMCTAEQAGMLQKGMTFRPPPHRGVILMSRLDSAPYSDELRADGTLLYEGHDAPRVGRNDPKSIDQPRTTAAGRPTDNGKFADWTDRAKRGEVAFAAFHVYEKLKQGIWTFRGSYLLRDYYYVNDGRRMVFQFELHPSAEAEHSSASPETAYAERSRQIPTWIKQLVYKRDHGRCVICGSTTDLHFDHDLPYSKGGSSVLPANVRLLCAKHNLTKGARIE